MGLETAIAVAGIATSVAGGITSFVGNKEATAASKRAEAAREKQMELENQRRQREIIRQGVKARAVALTNATAQNAQFGSGLEGGLAQVAGQTNQDILASSENTQIGREIFAANQDYASAKGLVAFGDSLGKAGAFATSNAVKIDKLAQTALFGGGNNGASLGFAGYGASPY